MDRHGTAGQGAHQQLPFGADIPDPRLVGHRQAEGAEQDWQGFEQQFREAVEVADGFDQQGVKRLQGRMPLGAEQDRPAEQGQQGGKQG
ncbi:hypothetical protein D3C80_2012300 [compost metagenome]